MQLAFYVTYIVGLVLAVGFVIRYHHLTDGAWRYHQTGIVYMGDAISLAVVLLAVVLRLLVLRILHLAWADEPTVILSLAGLIGVIGWIGYRWYLLERYQRSDKE
jgi:hypothetical protein